nr:hypothetical protein [Tanacetum cinerariifolium]
MLLIIRSIRSNHHFSPPTATPFLSPSPVADATSAGDVPHHRSQQHRSRCHKQPPPPLSLSYCHFTTAGSHRHAKPPPSSPLPAVTLYTTPPSPPQPSPHHPHPLHTASTSTITTPLLPPSSRPTSTTTGI